METLPNLRFMKEDAAVLGEVFAEGEIDTVYLNFSDPWPKKRHSKRRLTYSSFLDVYKSPFFDKEITEMRITKTPFCRVILV